MHFISQTSSNGVVERGFTIGEVTGLLWTPIASSTPAPLVLMGHGGGQHKRAPGIVSRAVHFVTTCGFAVAAIDAPGHGDRPRTVQDEEHVAALRQAQEAGDLVGAIARYNTYLSDRAVPEWQATLDALRTLPDIAGPVGYWGVALGTAIGVSLTAVEPRVVAAVFGLLGPEALTEAAGKITVPIQFLAQSDEPSDPHNGTGLYEAFASIDKTLISHPAAHYRGRPFELESSTEFLLDHLGPAATFKPAEPHRTPIGGRPRAGAGPAAQRSIRQTTMDFTSETSSNGVVERCFTLGDVTGVLWSPVSGSTGAPLILQGHTGGLHKKAPGLVASAQLSVARYGFTVAAIDAPGHGDRPRNAEDQRWVAAMLQARDAGEPIGAIVAEYNTSLAVRAVPEWQATLDALQALPEIGTAAPIGYGGTTLGTAIGLLLAAVEPRIIAASFGGVLVFDALIEAARQITIPVEFLLPWDDEEIEREPGLALFEACASKDKALHVYPGRHNQVPRFEADNRARFFLRNLGCR